MKVKISTSPTQSELEEIDLSSTTRKGAECIIGRSPDSDVVLDSSDVSRYHGKFFYYSGNYYFSDLGSKNGTIINGKLVEQNRSQILKDGDLIRIGDFALMLEEDVAFSQQSETVVKIINPSAFSDWKGRQNGGISSDAVTPSSELVDPPQEEAIAEDNLDEVVNTSEESTFFQADRVVGEDSVEENVSEIAAENREENSESEDVNLEENDSDQPEEIAAENREENSESEDVNLEENDSEQPEEIVAENREENSESEDVNLEENDSEQPEEIAAQNREENSESEDVNLEENDSEQPEQIAAENREENSESEDINLEENDSEQPEEIAAENREENSESEDINLEENDSEQPEEIAAENREENSESEPESEMMEVNTSEDIDINMPQKEEIEQELVPQIASTTSGVVAQESEEIDEENQQDAQESIVEEESAIKIAKVLEEKRIVLISHETKKSELKELVAEHEEFLSYCQTVTWQTFNDYLYRETGLNVTEDIPPATSGGYQAINSLINSQNVIAVIFLRNLTVPQQGQASEEALLRTCNIREILLANNLPTAQAVVNYLKKMKD